MIESRWFSVQLHCASSHSSPPRPIPACTAPIHCKLVGSPSFRNATGLLTVPISRPLSPQLVQTELRCSPVVHPHQVLSHLTSSSLLSSEISAFPGDSHASGPFSWCSHFKAAFLISLTLSEINLFFLLSPLAPLSLPPTLNPTPREQDPRLLRPCCVTTVSTES